MLFSSLNFILIFLPLVLLIYFKLTKFHLVTASKVFLCCASLIFYSVWNPKYFFLLIASILVNYTIGVSLNEHCKRKISGKTILVTGILFNLGLLGYFKYTNFFLDNINTIFHTSFHPLNILLPLGISFFTFQQITYLIDSYKKLTKEYDFLNYVMFVTFFPQLIAGPIVHHLEMMPQFETLRSKVLSYKNFFSGIGLFLFGLAKKVLIADTFAKFANYGFDITTSLSFLEAWLTSLSYTFQLYFDFSGYSDMAIGLGLMFNIHLPRNFNNPYDAENIKMFWRKWHMTLSRFLRDYIYIPLGGNRHGETKRNLNCLITMAIGGLWHGAAWTFVIWGIMHGTAQVIFNIWSKTNIKLNKFWSWFITFNFLNIAWVIFRAENMQSAIKVFKGMFGASGFILPKLHHFKFYFGNISQNQAVFSDLILIYIVLAFILIFKFGNFIDNFDKLLKPDKCTVILYIAITIFLIYQIINSIETPFLYFNF